jgi:hypothetical protein
MDLGFSDTGREWLLVFDSSDFDLDFLAETLECLDSLRVEIL